MPVYRFKQRILMRFYSYPWKLLSIGRTFALYNYWYDVISYLAKTSLNFVLMSFLKNQNQPIDNTITLTRWERFSFAMILMIEWLGFVWLSACNIDKPYCHRFCFLIEHKKKTWLHMYNVYAFSVLSDTICKKYICIHTRVFFFFINNDEKNHSFFVR